MGSNVVLRAVGVQWYLGVVEDVEQFVLSSMEPSEQTVQGDIASSSFEDAIEAGPQLGGASLAGLFLVGLEIAVEPPDQVTLPIDCLALGLGDRFELGARASRRAPS